MCVLSELVSQQAFLRVKGVGAGKEPTDSWPTSIPSVNSLCHLAANGTQNVEGTRQCYLEFTVSSTRSAKYKKDKNLSQ